MSPVYRGNTPISACYRGATAVSAIYRGSALVWSSAPAVGEIPVWPSVRSTSVKTHSSSSGTVTGETVPRPTDYAQGDLLLLYTVMDYGSLADLTVPTDFTQLGELSAGTSNVAMSVAYKVATGSEPASYTYGRLSASTDGASMMVAVKDWDGNTSNLAYAQQQTTITARAVPSVTTKGARAAVFYSAHHDNNDTAASGVWYWQPPEGAVTVGMSHNASKWSSLGVAQEYVSGPTTVSGRTWTHADIGPTTAAMMTSALSVAGGTSTAEALLGQYSGGSGGSPTDQTGLTFNATNGISSTYHLYAGGLDWSKDVGALIYTDGSAENGIRYPTDTYVMAGPDGMIATAKKHNMILLTPWAPGNGCNDGDGVCWYDTSQDGTTPQQKLEWSRQLIAYIWGRYNIDKTRVAYGGYSSGAQWTTAWFGPGHAHEFVLDGVAVAISYGGQPRVTVNNTAEFKQHVPIVWNVGDQDTAWTQPTWDDSVQRGLDYYSPNGYSTLLDVIPGITHNRYSTKTDAGEFGRIMDHYITRFVRPA